MNDRPKRDSTMPPIAANPKDRRRMADANRVERSNPIAADSMRRPAVLFLQSTLGLGLVGSLLMYAAQPPWELWPLAWIAPVPWLLLVRQPKLEGRRPYFALWIAGFAFWLGAIHWLRLPHWTTYFGWLALAFYLAFYVPVFVGLCRVAVHRLGISIVLAAPMVFTGLELARGHLLSGFTMGSLAHTQIHWLSVIQAADIVGCYGISGLIMLVAACIARMMPWGDGRVQGSGFRVQRGIVVWPLIPLVIALAAAIGYGQWRMSGLYTRPGPTVALIQGSIDVEVKTDENQQQAVFEEYLRLSKQALDERPHVDLLVWPETMYRYGLFSFEPDFKPPADWKHSPAELARVSLDNLRSLQNVFRSEVEDTHNVPLPPPLLLGIDAVHYGNDARQYYNSALFVDAQGQPLKRYDKMHPVMFGEYIPLAEYIPWLYSITPLTGGLTSGTQGVSQKLGAVRYAPDICYETVIPHLIRRQILQLRAQGEEPDVLVNITNDGWFRGSSELDMHLACGVFRAIEMRKPLVIAANTGFSASIDADGRIAQQGPRRKADVLIAQVPLDSRRSHYLDHGDWFSGLCLLGCIGLAGVGIWQKRVERSKSRKVQE
jgi:apolipoprotein N-acyltransferase